MKKRSKKHNKDYLSNLIKVLTPTEKAYFKKYVSSFSGEKENNYLKLFNEYCSSNKAKPAIKTKPQLKQYLYELILESLEKYHAKTQIPIQIKNQLSAVRILIQKGMSEKAKKIISNNLKWYESEFDYLSCIEALQLKRKIALSELDFDEINATVKIESKFNAIINNLLKYESLYARTYKLAIVSGGKKAENEVELKNILNDNLLDDVSSCLCIQAASYFYRIKSICFALTNDWVNGHKNAIKRVELLESNKKFIIYDPQNYINALTNVIELSLRNENIEQAGRYNNQLKLVNVSGQTLLARRETRFLLHSLQIELMTPENTIPSIIEKKIKEHQQLYEPFIRSDENAEIKFLMAGILINSREFKSALTWVNEFLQTTPNEIRSDIQLSVRALNLYLHLRLENFDLLPYLIRNTLNYFKSNADATSAERIMIKFIETELNTSENKEKLQVKIKNLKADIEAEYQKTKTFSFLKHVLMS